MKIELDGLKIFGIVIAILLLLGSNVFQFLNPKIVKEKTFIEVKDSSVYRKLGLAEAEVITIKSKLTKLQQSSKAEKDKYLRVIATLKALGDTIYVNPTNDTILEKTPFVAVLDTLSGQDSIRVEYYYPYNQWMLYHTDHQLIKTITNTKEITEIPFVEFTHGVQIGAYYGFASKRIDLGVGYGFQLRFNFKF